MSLVCVCVFVCVKDLIDYLKHDWLLKAWPFDPTVADGSILSDAPPTALADEHFRHGICCF